MIDWGGGSGGGGVGGGNVVGINDLSPTEWSQITEARK